ncbi:PIN domain-containing protein [Candidatus Peregrinibacteria bacterium]|jgi:predicted nucleic acid-binding protein|nr:PIN domain-containing protein [Candidatus Peregrinibacteria bacterium]
MTQITEKILERKAYLDTNIFIYAVEENPTFLKIVTEVLSVIKSSNYIPITSELSLSELLVKPIQNKDKLLQNVYEKQIQTSKVLEVLPVNREILRAAASIRAQLKIKLPDSIHVATAEVSNCDVFVCNDKGIRVPKNMERIVLNDYL